MSSPFFLSNLENLGAIMTSHVLTGMNYDLWSKLMMNALQAKNNEGFVNGVLEGTRIRQSQSGILEDM